MKTRVLTVLAFLGLMTTGFLCPTGGPPPGNAPPHAPRIDSIRVGIDDQAQEGAWIYFRRNPLDTAEDIKYFSLFRKAEEESAYAVVYDIIRVGTQRAFDKSVSFPQGNDWGPFKYRYKMVAVDSANPPNVSDTSAVESLVVCKQVNLTYPVEDTVAQNFGVFQWNLCSFELGCNLYLGVSKVDTILWEYQVCDRSGGCYFYDGKGGPCLAFNHVQYNADGKALVSPLPVGSYAWWIRVHYAGSSRSIQAATFVVNDSL